MSARTGTDVGIDLGAGLARGPVVDVRTGTDPLRSPSHADDSAIAGSWTVVHDFAFDVGGAERVTAMLATDVLRDAPVLTLGGHEEVLHELGVADVRVHHPRLFRPSTYRQASLALPLMLRLQRPVEGDVLASSYAFAHHVRATGTKVVYCHTPLRQVWSGASMYLSRLPGPMQKVVSAPMEVLRSSDRRAAASATRYVANSSVVAGRLREFYGMRDVPVVPPPPDPAFTTGAEEREDHYLWAGRIVEPYKKLTQVLEAFRGLDRQLLVVGDGRDAERLRAIAPPNVTFVGPMGTQDLAKEYRRARAVLFPSEDDFGLVPVEAMSCGAPVVALGKGGATETVVDGVTGVLFDEPTPEAILAAVRRFERLDLQEEDVVAHSRNFGLEHFVHAMRDVLRST